MCHDPRLTAMLIVNLVLRGVIGVGAGPRDGLSFGQSRVGPPCRLPPQSLVNSIAKKGRVGLLKDGTDVTPHRFDADAQDAREVFLTGPAGEGDTEELLLRWSELPALDSSSIYDDLRASVRFHQTRHECLRAAER